MSHDKNNINGSSNHIGNINHITVQIKIEPLTWIFNILKKLLSIPVRKYATTAMAFAMAFNFKISVNQSKCKTKMQTVQKSSFVFKKPQEIQAKIIGDDFAEVEISDTYIEKSYYKRIDEV